MRRYVQSYQTKYMLLSRHQNVGRILVLKIAYWSFGNVSQFKYLGMTVTIQNLIFFYSMVWVRERTIPTERPSLVGEATVNLCG
jgi:hypothetical protein